MATYYIDPGGTNSGPGTSPAAPWLTIQYAITNSTTGDTIVLAAGTYTQSANLALSARTYRGAGYASTIIDFASGNYRLILNGTAITIESLQIANITRTDEEMCVVNQVSNAIVTFNYVWFKALVCGVNRGVLSLDGTFGSNPSTMTLVSCLFTGCSKRTTTSTSGHVAITSASSIATLINCIIYSDPASAALGCTVVWSLGNSGRKYILKNCIIRSTASVGFGNSSDVYTGSATNAISGYTTVPAGAAATITADPLFYDTANNNFDLRPTSPCLNTGTLA